MKMKIVALVSLYNPTADDVIHIRNYFPFLEKCILLDDSEQKKDIFPQHFCSGNCEVYYEWNGGNIGLCKSLNRGIEKAKTIGADWILFLDSDSELCVDILSIYKKYISNNYTKELALLAPQHNYKRHKRQVKNGYRSIRKAMLSGCLIGVDVLDRIGKFDERFFIDGLDYEWCQRALMNKYHLIECSEAVINHNPSIERQFKLFGVVLFRYGWDTPIRYYYQFKALMLLHDIYHDFVLDISLIFKPIKAVLLFDNKKEYYLAWRYARRDVQRGFYGKCNYW